MRTTLSIDPDIVRAIKQIAAAQSRSLGAVISELARKGLKGGDLKIAVGEGFRFLTCHRAVSPFRLKT